MAGVNGTNFMYGMNPYAMGMMNPYASSMNDDFMAQTAFGNGFAQQQAAGYPSAFQGYQGLQQPTTDEFQKQEGGSSLVPALATGVVAGGATAAGIYKWGSNPIKDGKIDQNLLNVLNKENVANSKLANFKDLYDKEAQKVYDLVQVKDAKEYEAVKKLASVTKLEDLPLETRNQLPAAIRTPEAAKTCVDLATQELNKIDKEVLEKIATRTANQGSLEFHQNILNKNEATLANAKGLSKDATKEDLIKFFRQNEEAFAIKGTDVQKATKAEKLAEHFKDQKSLLEWCEKRANKRKAKINALNINLESQFKSHWNEAENVFKKDTPEALTKAYKNFKISKAGKWGAIALGAGAVLGLLFDKNA